MLTREVMGVFALGVLWLNTGLVLAVALRQLTGLLRLARLLVEARRAGELVEGVARCAGGPFALRRIHQTGRAMTTRGPDRVRFTDGPQSFEVRGGALSVGDEELEVAATRPGEGEVWLDRNASAAALGCPSASAFDAAFREGSKNKGFAREVDLAVRDGERVFVLGRRSGSRLTAWEDRPLTVMQVDPEAWTRASVRRTQLFLVGSILGLAAVTAVALWPPHFGLVSTVGGALCLAYFLAIQPLGTALRDAIRTPARRLEGATWTRPTDGDVVSAPREG